MVRDIRKLDGEIKQEYGLILASIIKNLKDSDVFQMSAFYKVLAYIQLPKKLRKKIMDCFISNETKSVDLLNHIDLLLSKVKGQERDILRFSLMQDILSVTTANHYLTDEKKELLKEIQNQLKISDEQMKIFEDEIDTAGNFSASEKDIDKRMFFKRKISKGMAIGIPLVFLYYSPHNAYHHDFKSFALLQIDNKINPKKSVFSLGKYLVLGGILYKSISWGITQRKRNQNKLEKMLQNESRQITNRGREYLEEDISYYDKVLRKSNLSDKQVEFKIIIDKTLKFMNGLSS